MKRILLLEDGNDRIAAFRKAVATLGADFELLPSFMGWR